jgi:hypothetical protein
MTSGTWHVDRIFRSDNGTWYAEEQGQIWQLSSVGDMLCYLFNGKMIQVFQKENQAEKASVESYPHTPQSNQIPGTPIGPYQGMPHPPHPAGGPGYWNYPSPYPPPHPAMQTQPPPRMSPGFPFGPYNGAPNFPWFGSSPNETVPPPTQRLRPDTPSLSPAISNVSPPPLTSGQNYHTAASEKTQDSISAGNSTLALEGTDTPAPATPTSSENELSTVPSTNQSRASSTSSQEQDDSVEEMPTTIGTKKHRGTYDTPVWTEDDLRIAGPKDIRPWKKGNIMRPTPLHNTNPFAAIPPRAMHDRLYCYQGNPPKHALPESRAIGRLFAALDDMTMEKKHLHRLLPDVITSSGSIRLQFVPLGRPYVEEIPAKLDAKGQTVVPSKTVIGIVNGRYRLGGVCEWEHWKKKNPSGTFNDYCNQKPWILKGPERKAKFRPSDQPQLTFKKLPYKVHSHPELVPHGA